MTTMSAAKTKLKKRSKPKIKAVVWLVWTGESSFTCHTLTEARKIASNLRLADIECVIVRYVREVKRK